MASLLLANHPQLDCRVSSIVKIGSATLYAAFWLIPQLICLLEGPFVGHKGLSQDYAPAPPLNPQLRKPSIQPYYLSSCSGNHDILCRVYLLFSYSIIVDIFTGIIHYNSPQLAMRLRVPIESYLRPIMTREATREMGRNIYWKK